MPHVELPQAEFKVVMLGDSSAGKTSLVLRFAEGYYRDIPRASTVGAFFITKRIQTNNGITCKIQIWDTAGQPQFRAMAPMYYKTAAAAILCYDVTSEKSYRVMRDWLDELHRTIPAGQIVIAIAPTKYDLLKDNGQLSSTVVPLSETEELANALGAIFVETSAKDNDGISTLFQQVAERVLKFREQGAELPVTPGASASHSTNKFPPSSPVPVAASGINSNIYNNSTADDNYGLHSPSFDDNGQSHQQSNTNDSSFRPETDPADQHQYSGPAISQNGKMQNTMSPDGAGYGHSSSRRSPMDENQNINDDHFGESPRTNTNIGGDLKNNEESGGQQPANTPDYLMCGIFPNLLRW